MRYVVSVTKTFINIWGCKMFYKLNLLGIERELPILKTPSGIDIAGFNPVGDMKLLSLAGEFLANLVSESKVEYDVILTTELKGLPIAQEVARNLGCDYVCLRKDKKCYMLNPKHTSGGSITSGKSDYFISEPELEKLKGKKALFVDDVFSTGSTFKSMLNFANNENFEIVAGLSILKETKEPNPNLLFEFQGKPILCCGALPLPELSKNKTGEQNTKGDFYE